jgi:hypothetical protein
MEVAYDNKGLLNPGHSDDTKANIYYIRQKFMRYMCRIRGKRSGYADKELDTVRMARPGNGVQL